MLRYFGVICIFIFAFYVIFAYERQQKRTLLQGEECLLLLKFFLDEMQSLARTPAECIHSFLLLHSPPIHRRNAFQRVPAPTFCYFLLFFIENGATAKASPVFCSIIRFYRRPPFLPKPFPRFLPRVLP